MSWPQSWLLIWSKQKEKIDRLAAREEDWCIQMASCGFFLLLYVENRESENQRVSLLTSVFWILWLDVVCGDVISSCFYFNCIMYTFDQFSWDPEPNQEYQGPRSGSLIQYFIFFSNFYWLSIIFSLILSLFIVFPALCFCSIYYHLCSSCIHLHQWRSLV